MSDEMNMHWLVFRDEKGWGCDGCDWTGRLPDFWTWPEHKKQDDDINIPF